MDQLQPSLRLLHCQTQAHVGCDIGPGFVAMCSARGLTHTHAHALGETTGVTGLRTRRGLYHTPTGCFLRVAAAVGVIPSDNGNLTPLGGPSSFIYRAHQKKAHGPPTRRRPRSMNQIPIVQRHNITSRVMQPGPGGGQGAPSRRRRDPLNDLRDANMTFCRVRDAGGGVGGYSRRRPGLPINEQDGDTKPRGRSGGWRYWEIRPQNGIFFSTDRR